MLLSTAGPWVQEVPSCDWKKADLGHIHLVFDHMRGRLPWLQEKRELQGESWLQQEVKSAQEKYSGSGGMEAGQHAKQGLSPRGVYVEVRTS